MRHRYFAKCVLILSMSAALTFHVVKLWAASNSEQTLEIKRNDLGMTFNATVTEDQGWIVLPGNITVHAGGRENDENISFMYNAENLCRSFDNQRIKLLIFVPSRTDHFDKRQAIRDTWGLRALQEALNFRVVYVLGMSLNKSNITAGNLDEHQRFGDTVQVNIIESYRNLGRKSVAGIRWSKTYCPEADFIMKTDDDLLVHIPNIISSIRAVSDPGTMLLCHQNQKSRILRRSMIDQLPWRFKYEVTETELPGEFYPPYCSGMAYIFSRTVRDKLLRACSTTPVFFIEDVYLTGFCRHKAGIKIISHPGISLSPPMSPEQAVCAFRDGRLTSQEVSPRELRQFWEVLNTQGFFCPELLGYVRSQTSFAVPSKKSENSFAIGYS